MKISILGTVGIPSNYGGFETLAENLVCYHQKKLLEGKLAVYCSANSYVARPANFMGAELRYVGLNANGVSSIVYDIVSLFSAVWQRSDVILLLGVSGAVSLPLIRLLSRSCIVTNVDGVEWKREKWKWGARWFLRFSERMAVLYSHEVVADNAGIAEYIKQSYGRNAHVIPYGGDHALQAPRKHYEGSHLPHRYALALCRIEPENNVQMILEAFASNTALPLIFVGNWNNSTFGRELRQRYEDYVHLNLLDPIYDVGVLRTIRENAVVYVHGHSAGGTNPSLVEIMHFGLPIMAYDCNYNRYTTADRAIFFKDAGSLRRSLVTLDTEEAKHVGAEMHQIAQDRYTWNAVGRAYFELMLGKKLELETNQQTT